MPSISEIKADLAFCLDADSPLWIWGAPGIGKSQIVKQVADARGAAFVDIRLSTFDPVDLRGLPTVDLEKQVSVWLRPAIWPTDESRETILFFDELDRAATAVANAALQIVLDRRIGEHKLPSTVRIVAAGNGDSDKRTTQGTGTAQAARFSHMTATATATDTANHLANIGVDPALVAFLRFRGDGTPQNPGLLITAPAAGEKASANPRSWHECAKFMGAPQAQMLRLCTARVGSAPALEFAAFVDMFRSLPSIAAILRDPRNAPVSHEINVNFAVAGALSAKADFSTFGAVATYAARMPKEFEVYCVTDAVRRDPQLKSTRAYIDWSVANQDAAI